MAVPRRREGGLRRGEIFGSALLQPARSVCVSLSAFSFISEAMISVQCLIKQEVFSLVLCSPLLPLITRSLFHSRLTQIFNKNLFPHSLLAPTTLHSRIKLDLTFSAQRFSFLDVCFLLLFFGGGGGRARLSWLKCQISSAQNHHIAHHMS